MVPGERLVMSTAEGPFPMETTYTWDDAGSGGTRDDAQKPRPAVGLLEADRTDDGASAMRRANRKDLAPN